MPTIYLFPVASLLTLVAAYLVWSNVWKASDSDTSSRKPMVEMLLLASIALTLWGCFRLEPVTDRGILFSLSAAAAVATLLVQGMYLIGLWQHGVRGLGLFLLPITALTLAAIPLLPQAGSEQWIRTSSLLESGHLLISLLAYAILTLAAIHAVMHLLLDRALKQKKISAVMQAMPSLFEIEAHLYAQVRWATSLLAIGILTGLTWQWVEFQHFALLNHKVLLALFSFATLLLLLSKRKKAGWHGRRASHMVLAAYALLLLAYFGAKLIHSLLA